MASQPDSNPTPQDSQPPKKPSRKTPDPSDDDQRPPFPIPWVLIMVLGVILVFYMFQENPRSHGNSVSYDFFLSQLEEDNVKSATIYNDKNLLTGTWKKAPVNPQKSSEKLSEDFNVDLPASVTQDTKFADSLVAKGVETRAKSNQDSGGELLFLWMLGPLMIIAFFWFMMRRNSDPVGGGMLGNFTRSPAKRFRADDKQTTFDDVAGMEQAKKELMEVVEFLKNPEKFLKLGASIPKGVLLMGSPGTGKTLMARATAGEAGVPFYSINGSEFIQMFVGVGASRVRDLFKTAKENSPCILFIDEIDAVGRERGAGLGGGHDEREQTLNQILSEMDGFEQSEAVIVIAATNRPDVLDPALLRPGRFDRHITIDKPSRKGRVGILKVHTRHVPLDDSVDLEKIAGSTIGFSGAELKNLVNEAALFASRRNSSRVTLEDFEAAHDRVLMGVVREDTINEDERKYTAYHEAGHALIAWLLPELDPLHKVTIVPRGRALGVTQLMPNEERFNVGERKLHSQLAMMLGGRAAEKLVFDEYSAGAEDDLKRATSLTRKMVAHWGMSDKIGPVAFRQGEEHPFLGKEIHEHRQFSEETAREIDMEVQRVLHEAQSRATELLKDNRNKLDAIANSLLEEESLNSEEVTKLIGQSAQSLKVKEQTSQESDEAETTQEESQPSDSNNSPSNSQEE
ncbi:MAG: ATP-dependent metallopeptidase FtsH/Yme1/Tma family protein [Planctomycetaceae bacterium]|nr:ATP-dependent metallopeptidase FtsH/Yme1/Tma family protein [Planctomycetaceae bacterium]